MITRYRISLNGTHLDSLLSEKTYGKNNTVITDIQYAEPGISRTIETPGDREGGIITKEYRQKASVTVTFMLRIYDVAKRNAACSAIKTWAKAGGSIVTNERDGQTLYNCVCEKYPEISSARNWLDPLSITFSSYVFPYWQDTSITKLALNATSATAACSLSGNLSVPGNAPHSMVTASVQAMSKITEVTLKTGSATIKLTNLSTDNITANHTIDISYDSKGNIKIIHSQTGTSLLGRRTAASSDFLYVPSGKSSKFTASANCGIKVNFTTRGAWL